MSALDYAETERRLVDGVVALATEREVVTVAGPDARSFLQGQVSQDVASLGVGSSAEALLLSPQGKLDAFVRVSALADESLLVDVEVGYGEAVEERLKRFKIRVKATLERARWQMVELRGPMAASLVAPGLHPEGLAIPVAWPSFTGVDLLGESVAIPHGVELGDPSAFEAARIASGWPRMGRELTDRTIAAEAGLVERTVSFTKGCYTGQELVARLDARGNRVPFRLYRFTAAAPESAVVESGAVLELDQREVGTVTSATYVPTRGEVVGLAYLRRDFEAPGEVELELGGDHVPARVDLLPTMA